MGSWSKITITWEALDSFSTAYVEAALWSSIDENGKPLDDNFDLIDLSEKFLKEAVEDCQNFQQENETKYILIDNLLQYKAKMIDYFCFTKRNK